MKRGRPINREWFGGEDRGYIYVFKCRKYYKIGMSGCVKTRLHMLQLSNPYKVIKIFQAFVENPGKVEGQLHSKFREKRHRGEWFLLNNEDIKIIKTFILPYKIDIVKELQEAFELIST